MTWEEETLVERLIRLLRTLARPSGDLRAARARNDRMRHFLRAWGTAHWPELV